MTSVVCNEHQLLAATLPMKLKTPFLLWLECLGILVAIPIVLSRWNSPLVLIITLSLATAGTAAWLLYGDNSFDRRQLWFPTDLAVERIQLRNVLLRFAVSLILLVAFVWVVYPANLLDIPRQRPLLWVIIMLTYPLLSVYPQEVIYRAFFFTRYASLFPSVRFLALASTITFGLLHIVFHNFLAVGLTLIGGWFFSDTYAGTKSLRLVCLEHTLYGMTIFTVGLGKYFYAFGNL
jgi:membrane protease YdiL (CAAX protease family)